MRGKKAKLSLKHKILKEAQRRKKKILTYCLDKLNAFADSKR